MKFYLTVLNCYTVKIPSRSDFKSSQGSDKVINSVFSYSVSC
jgi:hypothetical protein